MTKYRLGFAVALAVFALDQLTKWIVTGPLGLNQLGDQLYLLPFFQFQARRFEQFVKRLDLPPPVIPPRYLKC